MTDLAAAMYRARITKHVTPRINGVNIGGKTPKQYQAQVADPVPEPVKRPKVMDIKKAVCEYYSIEMIDLDAVRRDSGVSRPRHMAAFLACRLTEHSLTEIGRRLGGRDHTTIMHSRDKIKAAIPRDVVLANEVAELKKILEQK